LDKAKHDLVALSFTTVGTNHRAD